MDKRISRNKSRLPRKVKKDFIRRRGRSEYFYQHQMLNDTETTIFLKVFERFDLR